MSGRDGSCTPPDSAGVMATVWARISPHDELTRDDTISFITNLCRSCQANISADDIGAVYDVRACTAAQFHEMSDPRSLAAFTNDKPVGYYI